MLRRSSSTVFIPTRVPNYKFLHYPHTLSVPGVIHAILITQSETRCNSCTNSLAMNESPEDLARGMMAQRETRPPGAYIAPGVYRYKKVA